MSNKHIFFMVRFSILMPTKSGVLLARNSEDMESYRSKLFAPDRLEERFELFNKITLESLKNQAPCDAKLHLLVLTAESLPAPAKEELDRLLAEIEGYNIDANILKIPCADYPENNDVHPFEKINEISAEFLRNFFSAQNAQSLFATVRLDDDDGLAAQYSRKLSALMDRGINGMAVSFPYGYEGFYERSSEQYSDLRHWYHPKIALGLAFINKHEPEAGFYDERVQVYGLGRHTRIDENEPVLLDATFPAYFRTLCSHNDSGINHAHKGLDSVSQGEFDPVEFPFIERAAFKDGVGSKRQTDWTPSISSSSNAIAVTMRRKIKSQKTTIDKQQREIQRLSEQLRETNAHRKPIPAKRSWILRVKERLFA